MASELFGAPIGIIASEENIRQNIHAGLLASKTLGEIEQQPLDAEKKKAETEHHLATAQLNRATAAKAEADALELRRQQGIMERVLEEDRATRAAEAAAAAQGRNLTVADRPAGGFAAPPTTTAERIDRLANRLADLGMPLDKVATLAGKAAEASKDNAQAASSRATEELNKLKSSQERAERLGTMAAYALKGPTQYREAMTAAMQDPALVGVLSKMPLDFAAAKPRLEAFFGQAMTVKEQAAQRARDIEASAAQARAGAAQVSASAALMTAQSRVKLNETRREILEKNGGKGDPAVLDIRQRGVALREQEAAAKRLKEAPPAPLDMKARVVGKMYTAADGKTRVMWDKDPATGQMGWRPVAMGAGDLSAEDRAILEGED